MSYTSDITIINKMICNRRYNNYVEMYNIFSLYICMKTQYVFKPKVIILRCCEEACASFTKGLAKCDSKLRGALILDLISTHQLRQNKQ